MKLPCGCIVVCPGEEKIFDSAIDVNESSSEVDGGCESADEAAVPGEIACDEHLAGVVGQVPCEHSSDVSIAGESHGRNPAGFSEGSCASDVVCVVG